MREMNDKQARARIRAGTCPRCRAGRLVKREVWVPDPSGTVPRYAGDEWSCELHPGDESHYVMVTGDACRETPVDDRKVQASRTTMAVHRRRPDGSIVPVHRVST